MLLKPPTDIGAPWSLEDREWIEDHEGCILEQTVPADPIDAKVLNPVMWYETAETLKDAWLVLHDSFNVPLTESEEEWFEVFDEEDIQA